MSDYEQLSAEEIKAHLEQVAQEQHGLQQALEERRKEEKHGFVAEIKQLILDRGHDVGEIAELLTGGKKQRRAKRAASTNSNYLRYADPDNPNNTYSRGRMPTWLSEKMAANGFDPANVEHRQQFKEQHLVQLAA